MSKKLTIEFVREQFEKEDYTLLTEVYINAHQKLNYICPKKHVGKICWNSWQQGQRCNVCGRINGANKKRYTLSFIKEEFKKEGYILLSNTYINNTQKLEYICSRGHKGVTCWGNWSQGDRCAECYGNKKLTIGVVRKQFEKEGYTLISKNYINSNQKLDYICPKGHESSISWTHWQQGKRCMECSGNKKLTIEFIKQQFKKEGYVLLTKKYINGYQKLEYICSKGHKSSISWTHWQQGDRCKQCYLENNKGKNHHNWNSNLTDEERENGRNIFGYDEWAYRVKERDNFTCQVCGDNKGGNLISHHLESYNNNLNLRTTLSNGVCLCKKCHRNFHSIYGYGDNTREQFIKFINKYNRQEKLANV